MLAFGATHIGNVRSNNQDSFLVLNAEKYFILVVADGLGGHNAGEVASQYVVDRIKQYFEKSQLEHSQIKKTDIDKLIEEINSSLYEMSENNESMSGMGTTLTMCITNGKTANIFSIGDSRAYLIGEKMTQITKDHSLVQYMIDINEITEEEALTHPKKNVITRAVGTQPSVYADHYLVSLQKGERLLLCSDGLTNNIEDEDIEKIIKSNDTQSSVDSLIKQANENGGSDNSTVVVFEV